MALSKPQIFQSQFSTLLIYLAVRNKKKETDFYIKLLFSFR